VFRAPAVISNNTNPVECNVMQISENFSAPTKATLRRADYSPALYQIQSAIAKLLVSVPGQNPGRSSRGDSVVLRLQSVMMADVWWCS